jgi:FkbH-like protein
MSDEPVDIGALNPKVVVWDLDGTLWHGTLDAGDARRPRRCAVLLPELAQRGIVNTVCSNNSPDVGRAALRTLGIDSYVVAPHIAWSDKSELMADIVDFFRVAPDRIVLVDDDAKIRARLAAQYGVIAVDPGELERTVLDGWGTEGAGLDRLEHYRVLARRREAEFGQRRRPESAGSGVDFLRGCSTRVHRLDPAECAERIADLSMRSNQLNLTDSRLTVADVHIIAATTHHDCYAVEVSDRFGDYGLCGFVAFDVDARTLDHFFWSCRVLNQGIVEHFAAGLARVHGHHIAHPALADFGVDVDWVHEQGAAVGARPVDTDRPAVLFIGGCDLDIVSALMGDAHYSTTVRGLVEVDGVQQYGHSAVSVMNAVSRLSPSELEVSATRLPWVGEVSGPSEWSPHEVVVLSLWVDYCCQTVRCRGDVNGVRAPSYKRIDASFTDYEWEHWVGPTLCRDQVAEQLDFGPPLTVRELVDEVRTLAAAMPDGTRLILLNAAEIDRPTTYEWGQRQSDRNRELNSAVAVFAATTSNVSVLDIATIVTSTADLVDPDDPTGFHYRRDVYAEIAGRLAAEVQRVSR